VFYNGCFARARGGREDNDFSVFHIFLFPAKRGIKNL
jgi:hypothetical protein